jgi:hypothetical protein
MAVHIGEVSSEVAVSRGEVPLSDAQIDALVRIVIRRLEQEKRAADYAREATRLRPSAAPRSPVE